MTARGALLVLGPRERVVVRGGRGLGRAPAGVLVRGLQAAELEVEAGVEGGSQFSPGQATLAHMEGDLVGQLRDLSVPAVGAPLAAGQYAAVKTQYVEGK